MFYGVTDLPTFVIGTIFIVLLPGPNSLYVMTVASRAGVGAGYRGACGIFVGDTILMLLAATGAASLLLAQPAVFQIVKYAGAGYLAWIGFGLLRSAPALWRGTAAGATATGDPGERPRAASGRLFRTALLISLMNPKAILFFVAFFIQFVDPAWPNPAVPFLILGVILQFFSALYLSALIFGGAYLADQFRRRRRLSGLATGGVGVLFMGFGLKLADATLG